MKNSTSTPKKQQVSTRIGAAAGVVQGGGACEGQPQTGGSAGGGAPGRQAQQWQHAALAPAARSLLFLQSSDSADSRLQSPDLRPEVARSDNTTAAMMMPSVISGSQALRQCIHCGASMTAGARFASSPSVGQPAAGWWREQGRRR